MRRISALVRPSGSILHNRSRIFAAIQRNELHEPRVFISHKTEDHDVASRDLGPALSQAGLAAYFVEDDDSVPDGDYDELPMDIKFAVMDSIAIIVYVSDLLLYDDAAWVCYEIGLASMAEKEMVRYTTTIHEDSLLSPIRCIERVDYRDLELWAYSIALEAVIAD